MKILYAKGIKGKVRRSRDFNSFAGEDQAMCLLRMIKLLIFDLDGTLVDSAPDIVRTTQQLLAQRGQPAIADARIRAAIGEGLKPLVMSLFPEVNEDQKIRQEVESEFYRLYENNLLIETKIFTGALEFLRQWRGPLAIVTNKPHRLALRTVEHLALKEIPWFRVWGADALSERKPHPLPLLELMRLLGISREETLMIGDGIPDMVAARRAGVHSIACEFGYARREILAAEGASLFIDSFASLPAAIERAAQLSKRAVGDK